jgi:hypothetical protein
MEISSKALAVVKNVKEALGKSITGVSFVSIKNYTNKQGEIANHLFNIGIRYENAKKKDVDTLLTLREHEFKSDESLLKEARQALIDSFINPSKAQSEAQKDAYTHICEGLKVHNVTGELYIYGYRENKTVIKQGEYKTVNSKPLTIAKDEIRKLLKTNKFVNFSLEVGNTLKLNGETLEL